MVPACLHRFYATVVLLYARTLGIRPVKESWFWFVILLILGISQEIDNGMMVGRFIGPLLGKRAEILGGIVLIGIGAQILWAHFAG